MVSVLIDLNVVRNIDYAYSSYILFTYLMMGENYTLMKLNKGENKMGHF